MESNYQLERSKHVKGIRALRTMFQLCEKPLHKTRGWGNPKRTGTPHWIFLSAISFFSLEKLVFPSSSIHRSAPLLLPSVLSALDRTEWGESGPVPFAFPPPHFHSRIGLSSSWASWGFLGVSLACGRLQQAARVECAVLRAKRDMISCGRRWCGRAAVDSSFSDFGLFQGEICCRDGWFSISRSSQILIGRFFQPLGLARASFLIRQWLELAGWFFTSLSAASARQSQLLLIGKHVTSRPTVYIGLVQFLASVLRVSLLLNNY